MGFLEVKTITGEDIPPFYVCVPADNTPASAGQFINCHLDKPSRTLFSGVRATWTDTQTGQEHTVKVGSSPFKKIRQSYDSQAAAIKACTHELKRVSRNGEKVRIDLPGDPALVAEGLLILNDSFPPEMAGKWSIDQVVARGDASGYRCSVVATQPL